MSPLPITRSALDRLGERLVANDAISDEDYDLLLQVLTAYQSALEETHERLVALGYAPTTRVKTTAVLTEKLHREDGMKLKGVQDIAGARIVVDGGRLEQDEVVRHIVDAFGDGSREPKVKDRRIEPSAGYRAVHVVVTVQDVPVEVQVRTPWQDQWAQIVEALGDKWGRGIRYGAGPEQPELPLDSETSYTRADVWVLVTNLSNGVDQGEKHIHLLAVLDRLASAAESGQGAELIKDDIERAVATVAELHGGPVDAEMLARLMAGRDALRANYAVVSDVIRDGLAKVADVATVVH